MVTNAKRLNFLICSLSDRPLLLISHLSVINGNYQIALNILKRKYLDIDEIIDDIFQDIIDYISNEKGRTLILDDFYQKLDCYKTN